VLVPVTGAAVDHHLPGVPVEVVDAPYHTSLDGTTLALLGRPPDPAWVDETTGRTLTRLEAARALGHAAAWRLAASAAGPTLVVEDHARLAGDLLPRLGALVDGVGRGWDLLHFDDSASGLAYVVTPRMAEVLAGGDLDALVPVGAAFERAGAVAFAVDPPLAVGSLADPGDVLTDHLQVVDLPVEGWPGALHAALQAVRPGDVVLALPLRTSRLLGEAAEVLAAFARSGGEARRAPGPAVIGVAEELEAWLETGGHLEAVEPDAAALVFHVLDDPTTSVVLNGRLTNVVTNTRPAVAVATSREAVDRLDAALADTGTRDLARIFRYDGAAAPIGASRLVADDLLELAFWTPEFCATVVRAAEAVGAFAADEDDPVPGREISLAAISPRLFAHLEDDLLVRAMPVIRETWPYVDYCGLRDAFVIKYAPGQQEELRIHHDVAQLSGTIRLNDGYRGAALEFPRQGWDNGSVPVGHLIVWPSLVTHPHRATPLEAGVKYGLTIWFELPGHPGG
jgi:hypothetical protein